MKNKIILTAEAQLEDKFARVMIEKLITKVETLNDRTKNHTLEIRELNKKLKELEKWKIKLLHLLLFYFLKLI